MLGHTAGELSCFHTLYKWHRSHGSSQRLLSVPPYSLHTTAVFQAQERVDASCVFVRPAAVNLPTRLVSNVSSIFVYSARELLVCVLAFSRTTNAPHDGALS